MWLDNDMNKHITTNDTQEISKRLDDLDVMLEHAEALWMGASRSELLIREMRETVAELREIT